MGDVLEDDMIKIMGSFGWTRIFVKDFMLIGWGAEMVCFSNGSPET